MKKISFSILFAAIAGFCVAGDVLKFPISSTTGTVSSVETGLIGVGGKYLDSIFIDVTGTTTGTVTLVSSNETILSAFTVTADTVIRPRMPIAYNSGTALVGQTNAFVKAFLHENGLKLTYGESAPVTNASVVVKVYLTNDN
jgi:hypothetical protein